MRKASLILLIIGFSVLFALSILNMLAAGNQPRVQAMAEMYGGASAFYVVAFGMSMPLSRFLTEVGPMFISLMWPLLLASGVLQIAILWRIGTFWGGGAFGAYIAIVVAPPMALTARIMYYISGLPDSSPVGNSPYLSALTLSSFVAIGLSYFLLTIVLLPTRTASASSGNHLGA
jgi:Na+-driven multidrug efflux pump